MSIKTVNQCVRGTIRIRKLLGLQPALVACLVGVCVFAPVSFGQGAIRVESSRVLVPTVVFDKKLYALTGKKHHGHSLSYLIAHDPHYWESIAVRDLTSKDFHLFEDGQEQRILSIAFEAPSFSIVKDNLGKHPETIGTGGGRWIYPDLEDTDHSMWLAWPQYVIAFVPSESAAGSCHQIAVNMGRANLVVWTRSEYCNTQHPASDPLNGTKFGKEMEDDLNSKEAGKIDLKLQAVVLDGGATAARVNIQLGFPGESLKHEFKNGTLYASIGAFGEIYNKDGSVAARFSDFACCDYGNDSKTSSSGKPSGNSYGGTSVMPNGYGTQVELLPGDYEVRVIVSDGAKFGRKQIPLTVKNMEEKQPALSEIALCRRIRKVSTEVADVPVQLPGSYVPLISRGVEYLPAANTSFAKYELLYAYFEVFDPPLPAQNATKLKAHLKIVDVKTGEVKLQFAPVDATPYMRAKSSIVPIGRGIDLNALAGGTYRLEVQATESDGRSTGWRSATFVVDELTPIVQLP